MRIFQYSFLASLLLLSASCKSKDSLYCDESTPCTDPERSYCDLDGSHPASAGVGHTCIADPTNPPVDAGPNDPDAEVVPEECSASAECPRSQPICVEQECILCGQGGSNGNQECAARDANAPICSDGRCVECRTDVDCGGGFCSSDGVCGPCRQDDDCESGICNLDGGSCLSAAAIIYVDGEQGSDGNSCGSAPGQGACRSLAGIAGALVKVNSSRFHIVMATGEYQESVAVLGTDKVIVSGGNSTITAENFVPGPVWRTTLNANVELRNLTLRGGNTANNGSGIICEDSTMELHNVVIDQNDGSGINSDNCQLSLFTTTISANNREGLRAVDGRLDIQNGKIDNNSFHGLHLQNLDLELKSSELLRNQAGGVYLADSDFIIANTVIAKNGNTVTNPANPAGGILVAQGDSTTHIISHSTIVDNTGPALPILGATGVACRSYILIENSIITGNQNNFDLNGQCDVYFSIAEDFAGANGNIGSSPTFVNAAASDYHLAAGSAGIDVADPDSATASDIDGESRPKGAGYDMGADER